MTPLSIPVEITTGLGEWAAQAADRLLIMGLAMLAALVLGAVGYAMRATPQPILWNILDALLGGAVRRLDRARRSRVDRVMRGLVLLVIVFTLLWLGCVVFPNMIGMAGMLDPMIWEGVLLTASLAPVAMLAVVQDRPRGRAMETATGLECATLSDEAIRRERLIVAADRLLDGLVAPLVLYGMFGGAGVLATVALYWCVRRLAPGGGVSDMALMVRGIERYLMAPVRVIAGFFMVGATLFVPQTRGAIRVFVQGFRANDAPLPLGGLIAALGVSVGGPVRRSDGTLAERPWWGGVGASARVQITDMRRASVLMGVVIVVALLALVLGVLAAHAPLGLSSAYEAVMDNAARFLP